MVYNTIGTHSPAFTAAKATGGSFLHYQSVFNELGGILPRLLPTVKSSKNYPWIRMLLVESDRLVGQRKLCQSWKNHFTSQTS